MTVWPLDVLIPNSLLQIRCPGVCDHSSCLLSVLRGIRNGAVYGVRVRFPHALVMTLIFRQGSWRSKAKTVLKATFEHAKNLALFVGMFKSISCLLRHALKQNSRLIHLIAGGIGGAVVFGTETSVNSQINMYVMSRVIFGFARKFGASQFKSGVPSWSYTLYASIVWACVMMLFEFDATTLQDSLVKSMEYLYHNSDRFPSTAGDLVRWLIVGVA